MKASSLFALALTVCAAGATSARADSVAEFYQGKQIRMIVGTGVGDSYDVWARMVARHMRRHIPGNPNFVVENMLGAGTLVAANYLYARAPQDGTAMGYVSRNIPLFAFTKKPNVHYDPLKFNWIGSPEMTNRACFIRADTGVSKPEDLFEKEVLIGTDGAGTSMSELPRLLKNLLGMKLRTVDGYNAASLVVLAIERGEVGGNCQTVAAFTLAAKKMLDDGTVRILFTTEAERVPRLNVPTIFEYAKTQEQRDILSFHASALETGRPFLAPPNIPAERVQALRRAFDATMKDPAFLEEAEQRQMEVESRTGEQIEAVLRKVAAMPEELMQKAAEMAARR